MKSEIQPQYDTFSREFIWFLLILLVALLPRIGFVIWFPAHPTSDFQNIINLGLSFKSDWLAKGNIYWEYFPAGLPLILSFLFKLFPIDPEIVGRWSTVGITAFTALVPFFAWWNAFSLRARVVAGLFLALWPGQIIFSGIPAQDNWLLPSSVLLAALSARVWLKNEQGRPVLGALLYGLTVAIRQEMLIVMLPAALVVAVGIDKKRMLRNGLIAASVVSLVFGFLIVQRGMATGRYSLSTEHLGISILGSYIPGAGRGWGNPMPYIEIVAPEEFLQNDFQQKALDLAYQEFLRRPGYHLIRIVGTVSFHLFQSEDYYSWWSLLKQGVISPDLSDDANIFMINTSGWLDLAPTLVQVFFFTALFVSLFDRRLLMALCPILAAILLKSALHGVIVSEPRYYLVVLALQIIFFTAVMDNTRVNWKNGKMVFSVFLGIAVVGSLVLFTRYAQRVIEDYDGIRQTGYRFSVGADNADVDCVLKRGVLLYHENNGGAVRLVHQDPVQNESVLINCSVSAHDTRNIHLLLLDGYEQIGAPGRIIQVIYVNDEKVYRHDIADEPFTGWADIPLGVVSPDTMINFSLEVRAINPEEGWKWGDVSTTAFQVIVK